MAAGPVSMDTYAIDDSQAGHPLPKSCSYTGQHECLRGVCNNKIAAHRGSATIVTITSYATRGLAESLDSQTQEDAARL